MAGNADPRAVESICRALALVEEKLGSSLGVDEMAKAAAYSLFHFTRVFTAGTGHAPYDYLMRRRVAVAAGEVVVGKRNLTDIGLDHGFDSPEGFARAFRRCFGCLPSEARKTCSYPRAIARTPLSRTMVEFLIERGPIVPERLEREELRLDGFGGDTGADLDRLLAALRRHRPEGGCLAICELDADGKQSRAFVGIESKSLVPTGFPLAATILPGGLRARFLVDRGSLDFTREFARRCWLPLAGIAVSPAFEIVELGEDGPEALSIPL